MVSLGGLLPDTDYFLRTKARDAALNETPWTSTTSARTQTTRPPSLSASFLGSTSVQVAWGRGINIEGEQYRIEVSSDPGFAASATTGALTQGLARSFEGLLPDSTYHFRVGNSAWVDEYPLEYKGIRAVTLPASVAALPFASIGAASIQARWYRNGNPSDTEYMAEISSDSGFAVVAGQSDWRQDASHDFTGLSGNVTYYVRVKARNRHRSEGGYALIGATPTLASVPPSPQVTAGFDDVLGHYFKVVPFGGENHADTDLAILNVNTGEYLQGNGSAGIHPVWMKRADWESGFVVNVESVPASGTRTIAYKVKARNFAGWETGLSGLVNDTLPSPLAVTAREILDLDDDGSGDTIKLVFNQEVRDASVAPSDWVVPGSEIAGGSVVRPEGDAVNDNAVHIWLGNHFGASAEPRVRYKGTGIRSQKGVPYGTEPDGSAASDKVGPSVVSVEAASVNDVGMVLVKLSEALHPADAGDVGKWRIESPVGTAMSLDGAKVTYDPGLKAVHFGFSRNLADNGSIRVTGLSLRDAKGNARATTVKSNNVLLKDFHCFDPGAKNGGRRPYGKAADPAGPVVATFDRAMNAARLAGGMSVSMVHDRLGNGVDAAVSGTVRVSQDGKEATFTPSAALAKGCLYHVKIAADVTDSFGFGPGTEMGWDFRTVADNREKNVVVPVEGMKVSVNPGTFGEDASVTVTTDPVNNARHTDRQMIAKAISAAAQRGIQTGAASHYPISGMIYEIVGEKMDGGIVQGRLSGTLDISVAYADENGDGVVDGTQPPVPVKDLSFYRLDESVGEFEKVSGSTVDPGNKTVNCTLSHLSIYAVMTSLTSNVVNFMVRPNPWIVHEDPAPVIFDNLPEGSEIKIYTTLPVQLVKTLRNEKSTFMTWDGKNESGSNVSSDVYFVVVNSSVGKKVRKLTLVR